MKEIRDRYAKTYGDQYAGDEDYVAMHYKKGWDACESTTATELSELKEQLRWRRVEEELPQGFCDVIVKCNEGTLIAHYDENANEWYTKYMDYNWKNILVFSWLPIPKEEKE